MKELLHLSLLCQDTHAHHKRPKLRLVKHPILIQVEPLKVLVEFQKEPFVLFQLKVEHHFLEVCVLVLLKLLVPWQDSLVDFLPRQLAACLVLLDDMLFSPIFNYAFNLLLQTLSILIFIHLVQNLRPDPILDLTVLGLLQVCLNVWLGLERIFVFINYLDQLQERVFYMHLN